MEGQRDNNPLTRVAFVQGRLQGGGSGCNLRPNWAQGKDNYTPKGEEFPQIYGSYVKSETLNSCPFETKNAPECTKSYFNFHFFRGGHPRTNATGALPPLHQTPGRGGRVEKGMEGREMAGKGEGRERGRRGREGSGKFASLPLGIYASGGIAPEYM